MIDEQAQEAIELQKSGEYTNQQITHRFGVGRSTLLKVLSEVKNEVKDKRE